jgi:long-chain acyl-CoA synthetase
MKDVILSCGEAVDSIEVEAVIATHPAVARCAVIGVPDPHWGEAIHAVVILNGDTPITAAEIIAFCKQTSPGHKCPRSVEIRTEPFPLSEAGEVLKAGLRRPFWNE